MRLDGLYDPSLFFLPTYCQGLPVQVHLFFPIYQWVCRYIHPHSIHISSLNHQSLTSLNWPLFCLSVDLDLVLWAQHKKLYCQVFSLCIKISRLLLSVWRIHCLILMWDKCQWDGGWGGVIWWRGNTVKIRPINLRNLITAVSAVRRLKERWWIEVKKV